jgi:hypothetical protein
MGRKRKEIDLERLGKLASQGFSVRQIAKVMNLPKSVVWRGFRDNKGTAPSVDGKSCISLASSESHLPKETPPPVSLPQLESHHSCFSLRYVGKQPVSLESFHPSNSTVYVHTLNGVKILAYGGKGDTHSLVAWINKAEGATTDEIVGRTSGRARAALAQFAQERALTPLWQTFAKRHDEHFTIKDDELNAMLLAITRENPAMAKEMGILAGDSSHPDQPEFILAKGKGALDSLLQVIKEWPDARETTMGLVKFGILTKEGFEKIGERMDRLERRQERMEGYLVQIAENVRDLSEMIGPEKPKRRLET